MSDEEIVLKRLKETLDVLKGKNVIGRIDFQIRVMIEDCIRVIEKQSKEIEELKEENKEIREWKYVIDNPIDLKKLSELDIIKIFGKSYIAKDIIKARIKELEEYLYKGNIRDDFLMIRIKAKIQELQSLLEKE